jgi:rhamnose transport system ATP-binding protein
VGEVHALVGENGAGESTLVKIVTGIFEPSSGHIELDGEPTRFVTPVEARRVGVAAVYQDPKLFPHLDVAENIFMGATPTVAFGVVDRSAVVARARDALARIDVAIDPRALIAELSVAELQFAEIARALAADPQLLILDEPTSSLTSVEAEKLFRIARELRELGTAILFITQRLEELTLIADTVTVLRDGRHVATGPAAEVTRTEIVRMMVGRPLEAMFAERTEKYARPGSLARRGTDQGSRFLERLIRASGGRDRRHGRARRVGPLRDRPGVFRPFPADRGQHRH